MRASVTTKSHSDRFWNIPEQYESFNQTVTLHPSQMPLPTRTGDTEEELISMSWSRKFSLTKLKISARMLQNGLNWYPPWIGAGIRITDMQPDFRKARVTMPLTFYNRNFVGTQFGGSLYSMCDPLISKSNQLLNCDMKHR